MAVGMIEPEQDLHTGPASHRWVRWTGAGLVAVAAVALVVVDRRQLPAAGRVLRSADPAWVAAAGACLGLWYVAYGLVHRGAQRAAGLTPVPARELAPVTLAAHFLNLVTKSGAMAGLVAFDRSGRRRGQPPGRVAAAYLLAGLLGEMAFVVVLAVGLVLVWIDGQLTGAEAAAGAVFTVYLAVRTAVLAAALGDRSRARRLVAAPYRWWARLRRAPAGPEGGTAAEARAQARADELHDAVAVLRRHPGAVVPPAAAALAVEGAGVALLWTVLEAVGASHSLATAVVGYAISVLFSIVGFLPGGLGFVEVSLGAVLVSTGVGAPTATAAIALYRLFELWLPVGLGAVAAHRLAGPGAARPRSGRAWRWAGAAAVAAVGVTDLTLAAAVARPARLGFLGLDAGLSLVVGARYLLVVCGLAALLVSPAVRRGKRNAWWLALAAAVASVPGHHLNEADAVGLSVSLGAVAVLVAGRPAFTARSDPALARRGLQTLLAGGAAVFAYGTLGLYLLDSQFRAATTFGQSVGEALRLLFLLPLATVEPATRHGRWFLESVRFAALGVAMVGVAQLVATVVRRPGHRPEERAQVTALLERWATTSLAPFQLLDDKSWHLTDDGRASADSGNGGAADGGAFVGYKVVGTTAVALGGPIGSPEARARALAEWVAFCEGNGWTPALHQATAADVALAAVAGLRALKIGEEAVLDLTGWDLADRRHKHLRQALRRVERAGAEVVELPTPIGDDTLAELRAVSDAWLHSGGHRERTFTLGRFDADALRHTPILALREIGTAGAGMSGAPPHRILAFVNVLPSYRATEGNFDLMRRRPDAPNGAMEALFVALIDRFRAEGLTGMNLGLAPLSGIDGTGLADRALRLLYERGGSAFNYEGLRRYKEKWEPRWEPRYVLYRSDADLPQVAAAIARAGELPDPRSPLVRVGAVARRFPVTTAVTTFVVWLMAATAVDPRLHGQLLRQYGISWGDLMRLQLWRLPTSQLLQTRPGWVVTNLVLLVAFLPLAEWRLRSARTVAVLALADWTSTVAVLAGLRLAAALGDTGAAHLIAARDAGTSSALYAVAAATAASLPGVRARLAAEGGLALWLGTALVVHHRLFDVQHAASALAAVALWVGLERHRGGVGAADATPAPQADASATSSSPSPIPAG